MRILQTSDWHIGRTFHGYSTTDAAKYVLGALPELIKKHRIDVVVASDRNSVSTGFSVIRAQRNIGRLHAWSLRDKVVS
jgi:hypothetical protein